MKLPQTQTQALLVSAHLQGILFHKQELRSLTIYKSTVCDKDRLIVIDSEALDSLTPNANNFITEIKSSSLGNLKGLAHESKVIEIGTVSWTVCDSIGATSILTTTACYVPDATI